MFQVVQGEVDVFSLIEYATISKCLGHPLRTSQVYQVQFGSRDGVEGEKAGEKGEAVYSIACTAVHIYIYQKPTEYICTQ